VRWWVLLVHRGWVRGFMGQSYQYKIQNENKTAKVKNRQRSLKFLPPKNRLAVLFNNW
jgi:hypothetical protein